MRAAFDEEEEEEEEKVEEEEEEEGEVLLPYELLDTCQSI